MTPLAPHNCQTMTEVRAGVDATDKALIALLAQRRDYMQAAARIKTDLTQVRDEARKAQVIANACAHAADHALDVDFIGRFYEELVEWSIAFETKAFRRDKDQ